MHSRRTVVISALRVVVEASTIAAIVALVVRVGAVAVDLVVTAVAVLLVHFCQLGHGGWLTGEIAEARKGEKRQEGRRVCSQRRGMLLTLMMKRAPCGVWMCVRAP